MRRSLAGAASIRKQPLMADKGKTTMKSRHHRGSAMFHVIQLTPPGRGAVATLRIEGPDALDAVQTRFRARGGRPLAAYPVGRLVVGSFGTERGEEVVVRRGADGAIDLHCHGGLAAVAAIENSLTTAGGRPVAWRDWAAERDPDPFAAAAFAALADARTERTAAILLDQYHGALRHALASIRRMIDRGDRDGAQNQIDAVLSRAELGRHLVQPWRVVLAGGVNVGKSSLMNALAGYDRSIIHPMPGTTRDAVTVTTALDGWPVELCDTAGLRIGGDAIEQAGIDRARERLAQADLAILVFDRSATWSAEDQRLVDEWPNAPRIHNKCDLPSAPGDRPSGLAISALRGDGLAELLDSIARGLVPVAPSPGAAVPFTTAQVEVVEKLATANRLGPR
jgi:tRNA modification GTPase